MGEKPVTLRRMHAKIHDMDKRCAMPAEMHAAGPGFVGVIVLCGAVRKFLRGT